MAAYRSEADVSAALQALETKHELLRFKVDGWCAWPLVRFGVSRRMQDLPLDPGGWEFSRSERLAFALRDFWRMLTLPRARVVVKTYSSACMEREGGRKKDVFFDDLLRVTDRHFKIERPNSRRFHREASGWVFPPRLSTVGIDSLASLARRLRPPPEVETIATEIAECVRHELAIEVRAREIAAEVAAFHWSRRFWRAVFGRLQPECVLVADGGEYACIAAAREQGIGTAEFQHGFTHRHFPGNSWTQAAQPYKTAMALPHRLFLFGPHWARELSANGFWGSEVRAVGSMRIDRYRLLPAQRENSTCTIVVTTQGTDTQRLIAFMAEFVRRMAGRPFRLCFKMHPAYHGSDGLFAAAFGDQPQVELIAGSASPSTFELLQQAHLHVSIYSTCHYEALALGVPTAILPLTGMENVAHLHAAGHAFLPRTPAELVTIVERWRELRAPAKVGEEYFTPGALENIQRELADLQRERAA